MKEKLQEYALIAEIIGGIGIIASLVFVGVQLEQNSDSLRAQTRSDVAKSITDLIVTYANSPYLAELTGIDSENRELVSQLRFANFNQAKLRMWENIHYQYRNGLYEESEFTKEREAWKGQFIYPGMREVYCQSRELYSDPFVAELDSLLDEPCNY